MSPKIVRDQMLIEFVGVEIVWHTKLVGKIFYIKKINRHLIFMEHKTPGVRTFHFGTHEEYFCNTWAQIIHLLCTHVGHEERMWKISGNIMWNTISST